MAYNSNQPRDPAGTSTGGQWTSGQLNRFEAAMRKGAGLPSKLYHATKEENTESVLRDGIWSTPTDGEKLTDPSRKTLQSDDMHGVYVFTSKEDAVEFAEDNFSDGYTIFEVDASGKEIINDPEYDGESKFIITDEHLPAKIILRKRKD